MVSVKKNIALVVVLCCIFFMLAGCGKITLKSRSTSTDSTSEVVYEDGTTDTDSDDSSSGSYKLTAVSGDHTHEYVVTVVEATCMEGGYTLHECSCGIYYKDNETSSSGHNYTKSIVEPTCTETGYTAYVCVYCGDAYEDEDVVTYAALGHSYEESTVAATCSTEGYTLYTCSVCGDSYKDNVVSALSHTYTTTTTAATCSSTGKTVSTCTVCGYVSETTISALSHSWVSQGYTTEPSCSTVGKESFVCSNCGATKTESVGGYSHVYQTDVVKATCTHEGYTVNTCIYCGDYVISDYTEQLAHTWTVLSVSESGTTKYVCYSCGTTFTD